VVWKLSDPRRKKDSVLQWYVTDHVKIASCQHTTLRLSTTTTPTRPHTHSAEFTIEVLLDEVLVSSTDCLPFQGELCNVVVLDAEGDFETEEVVLQGPDEGIDSALLVILDSIAILHVHYLNVHLVPMRCFIKHL